MAHGLTTAGGAISPNGDYGTPPGLAGSLRLDVCGADHLAPLLGFSGDELSELDRAHRHRHMAYLSHPRLDLGFDEARVDLTIERLDDLGRSTTRCDKTNP